MRRSDYLHPPLALAFQSLVPMASTLRWQDASPPRYTIHTLHTRHALKPRRNFPILTNTGCSCCLLSYKQHRLPLVGITWLIRLQETSLRLLCFPAYA
jgi:hypothetical protein